MTKFLVKRVTQSLIAVLGITLVVFLGLNVVGDPAELMLPPSASREDVELMRERMGFNDPLMVQYGRFLKNAVAGDFGMSYYYKEPAMDVVLERLPATIILASTALLISLILGIPAGVISAIRRNTRTDAVIRTMALVGQCMPRFWFGILLILLFSVNLKWLPTSGYESFKSLLMPAFTLGISTTAIITRLLRSNMLEVMNKEYIDVARAKGLREFFVVMKHAFKNAISSVLTMFGLQLATLIGGAVVTETVFGWPGIGRLMAQSITTSDFMVVLAIVFIVAVSFTVINLVVDILYSLINPRIRMQ
jgi:peptide/nickel transport system permease protein